MPRKSKRELSLTDIKFLKGIATIEKNPDNYSETSVTEVPANTSSLRHVTELERSQINYRLQEDGRGFDELGYIRLHDPPMLEGGRLGPRSAELTDKGRKAIMDWEKRYGDVANEELSDATKEGLKMEIKELEERVDKLQDELESGTSVGGGVGSGEEVSFEGEGEVDIEEEFKKVNSQLDALSGKVEEMRDSPWGAVDDSKVGEMQRTQQLAVAAGQLFVALGVEEPQNAHRKDFDHIQAVRSIQERLDTQGNVAGGDTERAADSESSGESESSGADSGGGAGGQSTGEGQEPPPMEEVEDPFDRID